MRLEELKKPFSVEKIHWRVGATNVDSRTHKLKWGEEPVGIPLAYIDARDLYERLDEVCGAENWQIRYPQANGKTTCEIGIRIDGEWIWKANGCGDTQVEAEKGAYSDAAKRAGVPWGIAAYLYDMPSMWVALKKKGNTYVIQDDQYTELAKAHNKLARQVQIPFTDEEANMLVARIR